jgi:hypothetical protein
MTRADKTTFVLALLDELGLSERQLAVVQAMLDANRTGGATEYELAEREGAVRAEEPNR